MIDLPLAEQQAMRLDGELYRLADGYVSIAVPDGPAVRAAAALSQRPARLIAARATAAWIWGALSAPPRRGEYLVDLAARWRPVPAEGIDVVESVIHAGDAVRIAGVSVTSPLRTAIDLARFRSEFASVDATAVAALAFVGGFTLAEAIATMDRGRNLSGKQLAASRLRQALTAQPELTR